MYRKNIFMTLMENYTDVIKNNEYAINSNGVALQKNEIFQNSLQSSLNRLKASWEGFYLNSISSEAFKGFVLGATKLIETFGNLRTVVTLVGTGFALWKGAEILKFFTLLPLSVRSSIVSLQLFKDISTASTMVANREATALQGLSLGFQSLGMSIKAVFLSNPLGWIAIGVTAVVSAMNIYDQKQEEQRQQVEKNIEAFKQQQAEVNNLAYTYKQNADLAKTDETAKSKLLEVEQQLVTIFGDSAKGIDLQNGSIDDNIAKIRELNKEKANSFIIENQLLAQSQQKKISGNKYAAPELRITSNEISGASFSMDFTKGIFTQGIGIKEYKKSLTETLELITNAKGDYKDLSLEVRSALGDQVQKELTKTNTKIQESESLTQQLQNAFKLLAESSVSSFANLNDKQKNIYDTLNKSLNFDVTKPLEYQNALGKIINIVQNFNGKTLDSLIVQLKQLPELKNVDWKNLIGDNQDIKNVTNAIADMDTVVKKAFDSQKDYVDLLQKMKDGEKLTAEEAENLAKNHKELIPYIHETSDGYTVETGVLEDLRIKSIQVALDRIASEKELTNKVFEEVDARIQKYGFEVEAINEFKKNIISSPLDSSDPEYVEKFNANISTALHKQILSQMKTAGVNMADKAAYKKAYDEFYNKNIKNNDDGELYNLGVALQNKTQAETEGDFFANLLNRPITKSKDKKGSSTGQSFDEKYVKEYNAEVDKSSNKIRHLTNELDVLNAPTSNYGEKHKKVNEILDEQKNKLKQITLSSEKLTSKKSDLELKMDKMGINPNWSESKKNSVFDSWGKDTDKKKLFNELYKDWQETSNGIIQNDDAYFSTVKEIFANRKQLVDDQVKQVEDYQSKRIAKNELLLKQSQGRQSLLKEGTPEYSKEIDVQVNLHKEKQKILEDEAERLKKILATNKNLTEENRTQIQQKIDARSSGWWDKEQNINSLIRKRQEDELKYVEDAQNAMMDMRKKAGEEEKKILDKNLKTYEDNIDKRIKLLDELIDKENYDTSIQNQDKDINKKQAEIDALALDNSTEGLARKAQLEMDLADLKSKKYDDINKHKRDEEKKSLQNLKDVESKKVEVEKTAIDEKLSDAKLFNTVQVELTTSTVGQIIDEYEKMAKAIGGNYDTMIEKAKFFNAVSAAKSVVNNENSAYRNPIDITKDYNEASGKDVRGTLLDNMISLKEQYGKATTASQRASIHSQAESIRTQLPSDVAQQTSLLNTEQLKKYKESLVSAGRVYEKGGLIDFTGGAIVHGSTVSPEYILNAMDFKNLLKIVDITKTIMPMLNSNIPNLVNNNSNKNVTVQSTIHVNGIPSESMDGLVKRIKSEVWTDMSRKLATEGI